MFAFDLERNPVRCFLLGNMWFPIRPVILRVTASAVSLPSTYLVSFHLLSFNFFNVMLTGTTFSFLFCIETMEFIQENSTSMLTDQLSFEVIFNI